MTCGAGKDRQNKIFQEGGQEAVLPRAFALRVISRMRILSVKVIRIPYTLPEETRFVFQGFARVARDEEHAAACRRRLFYTRDHQLFIKSVES